MYAEGISPLPPAPLFFGLCHHSRRPIRHSLPVSAHLPALLLGSFSPSFILSISILSPLFSLRVVVSAVVLRLLLHPPLPEFQWSLSLRMIMRMLGTWMMTTL
ncbi:hypothetical protein AAHE18_03G203600 [Arachis hypogaea]